MTIIYNSKQWTHDTPAEALQKVKLHHERIYDLPMKYFRPGVLPVLMPRYGDRPTQEAVYLEHCEWFGHKCRGLRMKNVTIDIEPGKNGTRFWSKQTIEEQAHSQPNRIDVIRAFRKGFNANNWPGKVAMAWVEPTWFEVERYRSIGNHRKMFERMWYFYRQVLMAKPLQAELDYIDADHYGRMSDGYFEDVWQPALKWRRWGAKYTHKKPIVIHISVGSTYKDPDGNKIFYEFPHDEIAQRLRAIGAAGMEASVWSWSDAVWSPELIELLETIHKEK